eukprot:gnl/MRDRNA2_/MRDRNA2_154360_c0_seq1.p1 gnl/MRDRNA2_/MRDRNA2_154360_c0~~gnl/MRDRNA2_/MRDRNA2_154360_c0_seq1.p1  ORF type:complete len:215 (+),score=49.35 gnl/MRDRNA2_/MRDRNA2_154360_c0_seq1:232-876(+)
MTFNLTYSRGPFFLRGGKKEIDQWYASMGLPNDAPRWKVAEIKGMNDAPIDALYAEAGLSPRNADATDTKVWTETMTAHQLAQYAATESNEKGEAIWIALSRRFFMGKDTNVRPIRLDSCEMLMECAEVAGLDLEKARQVLGSNAFKEEINKKVRDVHSVGINSIPLFVFEVQDMVKGSWLTGQKSPYRKLHHGSGNKAAFRAVLEQLDVACAK